MHELLLHAAVPPSRHAQILSILAGLAATQPIALHRQHQVYKPNRSPGTSRPAQVGAIQDVDVPKSQKQMLAAMAGELYYLQVVNNITPDSAPEVAPQAENGMDEDASAEATTELPPTQASSHRSVDAPTLQFLDVPDPARNADRAVTTRFIANIPITRGSPAAFMAALDYSLVSTYQIEGHRLTYNNTNLQLYRVLIPSSAVNTAIGVGGWGLLDESGGWVLEASVRVLDGSKVETVTRATNELLGLRETLKGALDLDMVERLCLDTRVKAERG